MTKFIEAIAALNKTQPETDESDDHYRSDSNQHNAQAIVDEIMERCGKTRDDELTEEEFLDW